MWGGGEEREGGKEEGVRERKKRVSHPSLYHPTLTNKSEVCLQDMHMSLQPEDHTPNQTSPWQHRVAHLPRVSHGGVLATTNKVAEKIEHHSSHHDHLDDIGLPRRSSPHCRLSMREMARCACVIQTAIRSTQATPTLLQGS